MSTSTAGGIMGHMPETPGGLASAPPQPTTTAITAVATALVVFLVVAMSYGAPFLGAQISLVLFFFPAMLGPRVWQTTKRASWAWSGAAWLGLWLPALVGFFTPFFISTTWLLIPLCGPDSNAALFLPALAAAAICLPGALASMLTRRPWPWVAAAWLAPWIHQLVFSLIPSEFIC